MLYHNFCEIARNHHAIYDTYGNTIELYDKDYDSVLPKCDKFHVSYLHSAFSQPDKVVLYNLHEPVPIFDDLINFLEEVCPHITALNLQKLLDLVEYNNQQEHTPKCSKYFINQYISIDKVYEFLKSYKYC